jgi:hypothetical protein
MTVTRMVDCSNLNHGRRPASRLSACIDVSMNRLHGLHKGLETDHNSQLDQ